MANARILILGRTGQVGWELRRRLFCSGEVVALDQPVIDFTSADSIRNSVRDVKPAVIVNAAAYTAVDKAEQEIELSTAINSTAPGILAEEAKKLGSLLIHYSTDYVFDGTGPEPYLETDRPNPINAYGRTKLAGDEAIQSVGGDHLIFRTTWVYGPRGNNFLLTMLRFAQQRPELRIVNDQIGAPTSSECIAQVTADVLARVCNAQGSRLDGRSGIFNLTTTGSTSWYGFAKTIFESAEESLGIKTPNLVPILTTEFPSPASRPKNSRLSGRLLEQTFGVHMPSWQDALASVLESLKEASTALERIR